MLRKAVSLLALVLLSGCGSTNPSGKTPFVLEEPDPILIRLEQLAQNIERHDRKLSNLEYARRKENAKQGFNGFDPELAPELNQLVTLVDSYPGPLLPFLYELSDHLGLNKPRVLGIHPVNDVLLIIPADNRRAIDIMKDIGKQTGSLADVEYKARERLFEVQYHSL